MRGGGGFDVAGGVFCIHQKKIGSLGSWSLFIVGVLVEGRCWKKWKDNCKKWERGGDVEVVERMFKMSVDFFVAFFSLYFTSWRRLEMIFRVRGFMSL